MKRHPRKIISILAGVVIVAALLASFYATQAANAASSTSTNQDDRSLTSTPIKHVVVIFQENVSFDHYFGTYPNATNPAGEPAFHARPGTPSVNGLTPSLLTNNPNSANPQRLGLAQNMTCDQDHAYTDEQKAYDHGLVDKFVESASGSKCSDKSIVMDYYDGNTVTALWNYAQNYAMSDNSFDTIFGPSTPGALNLIAGQTHGATPTTLSAPGYPMISNGTVLNDFDPLYDDCSSGSVGGMTGKNIGDLLNAKNTTWGWFEGGFRPTTTTNNKAICGSTHTNMGNASVTDYIPHHEPFQYYQSTANPHHLPPTSPAMVGKTDQANHQYDLSDFWTAINKGNMPAVSFLKASAYQDGHAGYSDPLDEQRFLVDTINRLQRTPEWSSTAVVISYDDSDGWYDHVMPPVINQSNDPNDALTGTGACGTAKAGAYSGRCGYGPRLPLLVVSPFAKENFVDHSTTDQTSVLRFIEDNWNTGRIGDQSFDALAGSVNNMFDFSRHGNNRNLTLDPTTGEPVHR
ncbi:alkaline phosphatase family protein [Ktedonospora formicarum]|uniref:Phospholipase C n=1 Tax=Ktedonospora formicarum TaxID=2778364 RepID=A0A8J3MT23_9CHLR|nr:alkaline phosphatase family protein [Ktedonospora formicarum]GHO47742.1 phospholipase C [Ktedonospora formicarum]